MTIAMSQFFAILTTKRAVLQSQREAAPVIIDNFPFRRNLGQEDRRLQAPEDMQNVVFRRSIFSGNVQRDPPAQFTYGVITVTGLYNTLDVEDCIFEYNVYETSYGVSAHVLLPPCDFCSFLTSLLFSLGLTLFEAMEVQST